MAVSILFLMIHLVPGDPVTTLLGDFYNERSAAALREQFGLHLPLWQQYTNYLSGLVAGDLGVSFISRQPITGEVLGNFRYTIQLAGLSLLVSVLMGVPLGLVAALRRGKIADYIAMTVAVFGVSMPSFWLGILLMVLFSVHLGWLPLIGVGTGGAIDTLRHLVLPSLTLGFTGAGLIARVTRSTMLETMSQDYVRTAKAKGLSPSKVALGHTFRNAMLPVITVVALDLGRLLGGTTVVETVFSRPGTGTLLIQAVLTRDYPMIQGAFLLFLVVIILVNFLTDALYARLDPRVVYV